MYQLQPEMISRVRALNPYDPYLEVDPDRGVAIVYATRSQSPDVEFPLVPCDFLANELPPSGYYYISRTGIMRLIQEAVAPGKLHRGMYRLAHCGVEVLTEVAGHIRSHLKRPGTVTTIKAPTTRHEMVNTTKAGYQYPRPKQSKRAR